MLKEKAMKANPKRVIAIPPYGRRVLILVGFRNLIETIRAHKFGNEFVASFRNDPPTNKDAAYLYSDSHGRYILWLKSKRFCQDDIRHESTHLVEEVQEYVGESGGHEYRAYFGKWFYDEVKKRLR